jgi:hypothetical protein
MNRRDLIAELIQSLLQRRQRGLETYNVTVDPDAESVEWWLKEQVDELLDAAVYSMAAQDCVQRLRLRVTELEEAMVVTKERIIELEQTLAAVYE